MDSAQKLQQLFWPLLVQLPSLIAMVGCMVFVLTRWKRYPKVSLLTLIGLVLIFFSVLLFTMIFVWVPGLLITGNSSLSGPGSVTTVFTVLGLISNTALAIAFVPLLAAIFVQRKHLAAS